MSKPLDHVLAHPARRGQAGLGTKNVQDLIASRWIVGFDQEGSALQALYVDLLTGHVKSDSLVNFGHYVHFGQRTLVRHKSTLNFSDAVRIAPQDLSELCTRQLHAGSHHALFEFSLGGLRMLVPAQVLALALFGQTARMRAALSSPLGAERLVLPTLSKNRWQLHDTQVAQESVSSQQNWEQQRLDWTLHHASARAAFSSVYQHAKSDRMDIDLPRGTIDTATTGIRLASGAILVTRLTVFELRTSEPQIGTKRTVARSFAFRSRGHVKRAVASCAHAEISRFEELQGLRCVNDGVSHAQWRAAIPVVLRASPHALSPHATTRESLNVALRKYGQPCSWNDIYTSGLSSENAMSLSRKLKRAGAWRDLLEVLRREELEGHK
jgi:hypothetical protein